MAASGAGERTTEDDMVAPPHSTLAQLSYAPTVQTTVVTTTTTTTTAFPPFVFKASRNLLHRDPELYPLASTPTPHSLRKLRIDVDGRIAHFEEADDFARDLQEYNQKQTALKSNNGMLRSFTSTSAKSGTPERGMQHTSNPRRKPPASLKEPSPLPKHNTSPLSIAEDAELGRNVSRRSRLEKPANPKISKHMIPARLDISASRRPGQREPFELEERSAGVTIPKAAALPGSENHEYSHPRRRSSLIHTEKPQRNSQAVRQDDAEELPTIPRSTTPPAAASDIDFSVSLDQLNGTHRRGAPPPFLDTSPFQETSLPSPSLSPTTAAANLSRALSASRLRLIDYEEPQLPPLQMAAGEERTKATRTASHSLRAEAHGPGGMSSMASPLPGPSFTDIPSMLESFDAMPESLKTYVMHQLLRRCSKPTLHFVAEVVGPALKCDFLGRLPLELSLQILKHLDAKSMCRAAQVSKKWRLIVNSDEKAWKNLLDKEGFQVAEGEILRAISEGWGWQVPFGPHGHDRFSGPWARDADSQGSRTASPSPSSIVEEYISQPTPSRRKRKSSTKHAGQKRPKKNAVRSSGSGTLSPEWMSSLESSQGPNAYANAAIVAVPDPGVGLPSLSNLHLFKSIYQRHHQIRQGWMDPKTKPKHLAFRAHQRHVVTCLQFDNQKIITGSDDANIDIYDTQSGASVKRLVGHEGGVWALEYQNNILVSGSTDRSVRIWNIEEGRCMHVFQGHTSTVRCLQVVQPTKIGENLDGTPILMPKQPLIITGSRDSTCRVWKLPKPEDVSFFQSNPTANDFDNPYFVRILTGHAHSVRAIAAYGDTLVSGSYDSSVRVWKISNGETIHRLVGHNQKVYSVVLDHERGRCISGSMDNLVKVWSLETGNCLFNLEGHTSLVGLLDLRDGCLVSAAADSTLRVWDPENGRCRHVLSAHTGAITCFSHDGQKVISGSDRTLKMWNTKTGECVRDLLTDLSGVWQIKFDERRCIAAVQRNDWTYIEVLDFAAYRDGVPEEQRGRRIVVDSTGEEIDDDYQHGAPAVDDDVAED